MLNQRTLRRLERIVARGWAVEIDGAGASWRLIAFSSRHDTTALFRATSLHVVVRQALRHSLEY